MTLHTNNKHTAYTALFIPALLVLFAPIQSYGLDSGGASGSTNSEEKHGCKIIPYIDIQFKTPLTDYKPNGKKPRSPRYIFGINDPIPVEVVAKHDFGMQVIVVVVNQADHSQVELTLQRFAGAGGTHYYRTDDANHLYLTNSQPATAARRNLLVVDEPVLDFSVKPMPECRIDWMVDRGERSSGGAVFYGGQFGDATVVRFPHWYENGHEDFDGVTGPADRARVIPFINRFGSDPADGRQADLLHWASHGNEEGKLGDNFRTFYDPRTDGIESNEDAEFLVLAACSALDPGILTGDKLNSGFYFWRLLLGQPHGPHIIFGAVRPLGSNLLAELALFYDGVANGDTYVDAYTRGMSSTGQPAAMIVGASYINDRFKEVGQDGEDQFELRIVQ